MEAGDARSSGTGSDGLSRRRAGELSGLVLDVLRSRAQALTPAEVSQQLVEAGAAPLAYTTVVTILSRLHTQGVAERSRRGRAYAYRPVSDPARLAAGRMRRVLERERDRHAVLASFIGELAPGDEQLLRELLGTDLTGDSTPGDR
jgi:predicted transcriptional regulator